VVLTVATAPARQQHTIKVNTTLLTVTLKNRLQRRVSRNDQIRTKN
jgi:hypothetical protein